MATLLIRNGTAYPVKTLHAIHNGGFLEIACIVQPGGPRSVLYNAGSLHWALPGQIHDGATVKKQRGNRGLLVKSSATDRAAFLETLPKAQAVEGADL